jgi:hypothetical protein
MATTVKRITLWRREVPNRPGELAATLAPLAEAGANLDVVMGYRFPGNESLAAIEVYPVTGRKAAAAAERAGLADSGIPTLLVQGTNRAGLGASFAQALSDARINMAFLVAQVIGRTYSAVIGFDTDADAKRAATLLKRAGDATRRR